MKYVIIRCEDVAKFGPHTTSLLEGAKTSHLQQLSQAGAAGLIRTQPAGNLLGLRPRSAIDRPGILAGLVGLSAEDPDAAAGRWYAAAAQHRAGPDEIAWCCDLVTQQDGIVVDATAGDITTKESQVLADALNNQLGSDTRRWSVLDGPQLVLITRDPALAPDRRAVLPSPGLLLGQDWKRQLPRGGCGDGLAALLEQSAKILEEHFVNRVRIDLGENPATLLWCWGGSELAPVPGFTARTGLSGALVSSAPVARGMAAAYGLHAEAATAALDEPGVRQIQSSVIKLLKRFDIVYAHLQVRSADPVERLCAMERIDQSLLKPLSDQLPKLSTWRLLAAIDDCADGSVAFIGLGSGLPQHPVARLRAEALSDSALAFRDGAELFAWLTAGREAASAAAD